MLSMRPVAARARMVVPPTSLPNTVPSHSRYVFRLSTVSAVNLRDSYSPWAVATKKASMAAGPDSVWLRNEASITAFVVKAAANSRVPLLLTIVSQSDPISLLALLAAMGCPSIQHFDRPRNLAWCVGRHQPQA